MISATENKVTNGLAASSPEKPAIKTNSDFSTFLRLLTTQLQNQDPLNPMEGSEFAVQLATFSGVEQQAHTNKLLGEMIAQTGASGLGPAASWIGKEALSTAPVWFGDEALTLEINPDPRADDVALIVLDAKGREISRETIGTGSGQVDWFGRDASGQKLPDGRYSFRIESMQGGEPIAEADVGAYAKVLGVRTGPNGVELVFEDDASVPLTQVGALRQPG